MKSIIKMHFPVLISGLILILMLTSFLSSATITDNKISIEPTSRNLILSSDNPQPISARGPYTIDGAIESETDMVRIPDDALSTMEMSVNDTIIIKDQYYKVNNTRDGEGNTFRLSSSVRQELNLVTGEIIADSRIPEIFKDTTVIHEIKSSNLTNENLTGEIQFDISSKSRNAKSFNVILDDKIIASSVGIFDKKSSYTISLDNKIIGSFKIEDIEKGKYTYQSSNHKLTVIFEDKNSTSIRHFVPSDRTSFIKFYSNN